MAFDAAAEAQKVRKAMKGMGSDEDAMINVLCKRSNAELQEVRAQFTKQFSRDMIEDIRSEVSGKLESLLAGLAYTPGE
jgi:annexin A7/11